MALTDHNYFAVIRSLVCIDPINGKYTCKYYVMDQSTIGASTMFWHEGMNSGTPLSSAPSDGVLLGTPLQGTSLSALTVALQNQCQTLAARLSSANTVANGGSINVVVVSAGTITPVIVTY